MSDRVGVATTSGELPRLAKSGFTQAIFDYSAKNTMLDVTKARPNNGCVLVLRNRLAMDAVTISALTAGRVRVVALSDFASKAKSA